MSLHASPSRRPSEPVEQNPRGRPWLGVNFVCSGMYQRVYRDLNGDRYLARCPRCGKTITFKVGPGGSNQRFFDVSC